jgi:hypothetical protein
VDPLALIWVGIVVFLILAFWLVGRLYPGSGLQEIGLKDGRQIIEQREALEAEDLDQMLAAHNARRRRRGEPELTVDELELRVAETLRDQQRLREQYLAERGRDAVDEDIDQLLAATNARRRARGEPERTRDDVRGDLET